jgi:hypothetical protein
MFTFVPDLWGFYVSITSVTTIVQALQLAGYPVALSQITIPVPRSQKSYYTLQYNGMYWTEAGHNPCLQEEFVPFDDSQLTNGQVYFQWDAANSRFELFQRNGPGGLIVDNGTTQIPTQVGNQEIWMGTAATSAGALNYFYARYPKTGESPVRQTTEPV